MRLTRYPSLLLFTALLAALPGCKGKSADGTNSAAAETPGEDAAANSKVSLPVVGAVVRKGDLILSINTTGQVAINAAMRSAADAFGVAGPEPGFAQTKYLIAQKKPKMASAAGMNAARKSLAMFCCVRIA